MTKEQTNRILVNLWTHFFLGIMVFAALAAAAQTDSTATKTGPQAGAVETRRAARL
jgi:hypothetical protein